MIYFLLFVEFFKVGLFSIGGGYATLPFLFHLSEKYDWYSAQELSQMLAVASITPGPVGINVATYAGFKTAGISGAAIATLSLVLPSIIIIVIVARLLDKFKCNFYTQAALYALKPATCAMIAGIGVKLFKNAACTNAGIDLYAVGLFLLMFLISLFWKGSPLFYLGFAAIAGIIIQGVV